MTHAVTAAGTVHGTGGGIYLVQLVGGRQVAASLRGRVKLEARIGGRIVVGDRVRLLSAADGSFTIEGVEPRVTQIVRRSGPGRRPKVVAANLDRMLVVAAARDPEPRPDTIDRLLALAESDGIAAVVVLNKLDLADARVGAETLLRRYARVGYRTLAVSASAGEGLEALRSLLSEGISALVGPSGVGKSSLLNALEPGLSLRTGELSSRSRQGRHTTVSARLLPVGEAGLVADTPGFAEVGLWGVDLARLDLCFPELRRVRAGCRFRGCAHVSEPECAVREAVEAGLIEPTRYASYLRFRDELASEAR